MEFQKTLLVAELNQQQNTSNNYYKTRYEPLQKEQRLKNRLSVNIQKFLANKDEEERQKKVEAKKKTEGLSAMRDPKALRKIQKTLKVIKSANKSVLQDAVDRDNTAVTLTGLEQPDQDDYGYESQEAAAMYAKMMEKYSKIPDEPKFPTSNQTVIKDLKGTMERVKLALQQRGKRVPNKRRRKTTSTHKDSPLLKCEPEKKDDIEKNHVPKIRKPMPPPMNFIQLLKLADQKKSEPVEVALKKAETKTEKLMTKSQKREYEEKMVQRQRRQERDNAERNWIKSHKEKLIEEKRKSGAGEIGCFLKLKDKSADWGDIPLNIKEEVERQLAREKMEKQKKKLQKVNQK